MSQLKGKNATVLGISTDTVESHKRFVEKEHLNFPLLADTEKKMVTAYGVLAPNGFASRVTFVIDPNGKIREIDRAVNAQFNREGTALTTRHADNLVLLLSDWRARIDHLVPNFSVAGIDGKTESLMPPGKKASVVFFLSARGRQSQAYADRMRALAADPAYKDVAFLALYPNADETSASIKSETTQRPLGIPVAKDTGNRLADHFTVTTLPMVWVVNAKGVAVYQGAIDDNADPALVSRHYVKDALDATLTGKPPAPPVVKPTGTPVKRAAKPRTF